MKLKFAAKKVPIDVVQEIVVDLEDEKVSTYEVDFWNSFRVKFGSASSAGADLDKEQLLVREGQGGDHAESSLDYGEQAKHNFLQYQLWLAGGQRQEVHHCDPRQYDLLHLAAIQVLPQKRAEQ